MIPQNEKKTRQAAIKAAAKFLTLSIIPSKGYCPGKIGTAFADAIVQTLDKNPELQGHGLDYDLGLECMDMIMQAALARLNEHYENRNK